MSEAARAAALELLPEMIFARRDRLARDIADAVEQSASLYDSAAYDRLRNLAHDAGTDDRHDLALIYGLTAEFPFRAIERAIQAAAAAYLEGATL